MCAAANENANNRKKPAAKAKAAPGKEPVKKPPAKARPSTVGAAPRQTRKAVDVPAEKPKAKRKVAATKNLPVAVIPPPMAPAHEETVLQTDTASKQDQTSLTKLLDWCIDRDADVIRNYVAQMRKSHPGLSKDELAQTIVSRRALKNGMIGALTGVGGAPALPFTVPTNVIATWRVQVFTIMCVAHVYGHLDQTEDLRTDIYMILAGDAANEALKRTGIELTKNATRSAIRKYANANTIKQVNKVLGKKIISSSAQKTMVRMVPVIGAAVGFIFDWSAAQSFGKNAITYYSEKKKQP